MSQSHKIKREADNTMTMESNNLEKNKKAAAEFSTLVASLQTELAELRKLVRVAQERKDSPKDSAVVKSNH